MAKKSRDSPRSKIATRPKTNLPSSSRPSREMVFRELTHSFSGPIAIGPGNINLATGCTWQTIWDGSSVWGRDYRINNNSGGQMEIEIDGTVITPTLGPYQSTDAPTAHRKVRVHAPTLQPGSSSGTYELL